MNRRRTADGLSFGVAYTYTVVQKNLNAIDPFVSDNRARNYNTEQQAAAQPGRQLLVRDPEPEPEMEQPLRQGTGRQLAGVGHHVNHERDPAGLLVHLYRCADGRAQRNRRDQRRRKPARHRLRSQHLAWRSQLRRTVRYLVHPAPIRSESSGEFHRRRVLRTGVHELGLLVLQVRSDGHNAPAVPMSSCTTPSTTISGPRPTRARFSTT